MAEASQPRHLATQTRQPDQPPTPGPSLPSALAAPLLTSFATFLTLSIHSLLYHRQLYPSRTFITARAYNLPVQQSRHAGVCRWVNDAVSAVAHQLAGASAERVVFVVHAPKGFEVLERWVFDVGLFPEWGEDVGGKDDAEGDGEGEVNWTDVNEGLRGGLRRLAYAAEKMEKPPEGSTFTLAVELKDDAPAPIAHPQHWIPSQPGSRPASRKQPEKKVPEKSTTPVRAVQAGPLFFECWIEQPKPKPEPTGEPKATDATSSKDSSNPAKDDKGQKATNQPAQDNEQTSASS